MTDNRSKTKLDRRRVALSQPWERSYWKKVFGVGVAKLKQAVKTVGTSARRVRAWLNGEPVKPVRKRAAKK